MNVSESNHLTAEMPTAVAPPGAVAEYAQCADCGAAVDHVQRYCVSCGARQRHVDDPAARFLSRSTGRAQVPAAAAEGASMPAGRRRFPGLVVALLLALIPVTVAVGVVVGRSSNNDDSQLIRELSATQAQPAAASRSTTTAPAAVATATAAGSTASHRRTARHTAARKGAAAGHNANASKAPSAINGSASAAKQQQGAAIVSKLQHTNGTSYLNQLPSQVVVP
jgi:hypothetical protein